MLTIMKNSMLKKLGVMKSRWKIVHINEYYKLKFKKHLHQLSKLILRNYLEDSPFALRL